MAITRLIIIIIPEASCERCGSMLGRNIMFMEGQLSPELLCRKCHEPRVIGPDGIGRALRSIGREALARNRGRREEIASCT